MAEPKNIMAYRCPKCGTGIMSPGNLMNLTGDMFKLSCDCGKSTMLVEKQDDQKVRLDVPCLLCGRNHEFVVRQSMLTSGEPLEITCPYSDMVIFWSGELNEVKAKLAQNELQLLNYMDEQGIDGFDSLHPDGKVTDEGESEGNDLSDSLSLMQKNRWYDPDIVESVLFVIKELDEDHRIYCKCPAGTEKEFTADITEDGIWVCCKKCGAKRLIPTDPGLGSSTFLEADSLHLE